MKRHEARNESLSRPMHHSTYLVVGFYSLRHVRNKYSARSTQLLQKWRLTEVSVLFAMLVHAMETFSTQTPSIKLSRSCWLYLMQADRKFYHL